MTVRMLHKANILFRTSVQEAVESSLQHDKALFVFLSKEDTESEGFIRKFLYVNADEPNQSLIRMINEDFISLKLVEGSTEFEFFKQIFKNLLLPSFYIVSKGQLLDVVTNEITANEFNERLYKALNLLRSGSRRVVVEDTSTQANSSRAESETPAQTIMLDAESNSSNSNADTDSVDPPVIDTSSVQRSTPKKRETSTISQHEESVARHKQQMVAIKKEQLAEKGRIRALLKADQKERESRKREAESNKRPAVGKDLSQETKKPSHRYDICSLSIKLFDGSSLKHDFKADQTLNDVRTWLDNETNGEIIPSSNSLPSFATSSYPQPIHYVFHRPGLPRITYTDDDEFKKLLELELCPRSALILKPIYDDKGYSKSYPNGKSLNGGALKRFGSTLSKIGNALYSFFDYGVDDVQRHHSNDFDDNGERSRSPNNDEDSFGRSSGLDSFNHTGSRNDESLHYPDNITGRNTPNILSIDASRHSSTSLINFHPQSTSSISQDSNSELQNVRSTESRHDSTYNSRTSTPKPLGSLHSASRVQTIHGEVKDSSSSSQESKDKMDNESYNGNDTNLQDHKKDD